MPTMTRFIVFAKAPPNLHLTEGLAREAAEHMAKNDPGTEVQVWRLDGTRLAKYTAAMEATVVED